MIAADILNAGSVELETFNGGSFVQCCADEFPELFSADIPQFDRKAINGLLTNHEIALCCDSILEYVKSVHPDYLPYEVTILLDGPPSIPVGLRSARYGRYSYYEKAAL